MIYSVDKLYELNKGFYNACMEEGEDGLAILGYFVATDAEQIEDLRNYTLNPNLEEDTRKFVNALIGHYTNEIEAITRLRAEIMWNKTKKLNEPCR